MSRKREDEQTTLTANWLNTVSAGMITVGVVGPVAAAIVSFPVPPFDRNLVVGAAVWLSTGLGLHWAARYSLLDLSDD